MTLPCFRVCTVVFPRETRTACRCPIPIGEERVVRKPLVLGELVDQVLVGCEAAGWVLGLMHLLDGIQRVGADLILAVAVARRKVGVDVVSSLGGGGGCGAWRVRTAAVA